MTKASRAALAILLLLVSGSSAACVFGVAYNLPIPFQMYASGAAAALLASFLIVGYVVKVRPAGVIRPAGAAIGGPAIGGPAMARPRIVTLPEWFPRVFSRVSVGGLLLTVATGYFGSSSSLSNFGVTFFWIIFALGFSYAVALFGDVYALINPWRALCSGWERRAPGAFRGRVRYPERLGYYPAFALYLAFVWIELFGEITPRALSEILVAYTGVTLCGAWLFGPDAWFKHGEFFSVLFRLIGKMAPLKYVPPSQPGAATEVVVRKPFIGLLEEPADHVSLLLFVLFMLSSTAYDGAHVTRPWVGIFWKRLYPLLTSLGDLPNATSVTFYYAWQWSMLLLSPLIYLVVYVLLLWLSKIFAGSEIPLRVLALRFAFTLVPIAFVYNMTHYYGELLAQGVQIVQMVSDPFAAGWNLFGTARWTVAPIILDAGAVWHSQVALILLGHIVAVYLAHVEALRVFSGRRLAVLSQLPMLALMVLLTMLGLWILSLPIAAGQVTLPVPG